MDELDLYWEDIRTVFGLTKLFGPQVTPSSEFPLSLGEKTCIFLQNDKEMAEFIEDFVLDSYNIMLREEIVPRFWSNFVGREENVKSGFHKFCQAIKRLHRDVKEFSPKLEELQRLRDVCDTHRTLYGQRTVGALFSVALKGSLHSQLDTVHGDWQHLVKQFYNQSFTCHHKEPWSGGGDTSVQSLDESSDWQRDISCGGCGQQSEMCQCASIITEFHLAITRMSELGIIEKLADQVVMEIVQEKINSHVQETCKGSFDISFLSSLEEWLDRVVLVWVRAANINTVSRRKLLDNLYHTYTKERIEQLFNIIIEWPDSQAALEDVRVCLASTDLRGHLTKSLKRVLDNKLLHPGVNTADILTAYIAAIRALSVLDPSGVILQLVCADVRRYLKTREDTVRCIVQSLISETDTELKEELQKTQGLQLDHSFQSPDDFECLDDWENWLPDPVDAPSKNNSRRTSDIVSMLVNIYGSKELFVNEYRSLLSNRLLAHCSYDTDKEIRHLELLKLRFGEIPLHQCEVMLKDIGDSKRINTALHTVEGGCPELQTQAFPVNALILSAQFWPNFKNETLELSTEIAEALDVYTKAFQTLKGNRTLVWKPHLGFANIDVEIGDKKLNVTVSPILAAILYKFQETPEWTAQQLAASIKVPVSTLRRKISYWQSQGVIVETASDVYSLVEDGDTRGEGVNDLSSVAPGMEDEEDSVTASSADQREEEFGMFWSYIMGMLTNLDSMPLERIYQTLRIFVTQGPSAVECDIEELRAFLDSKVRQHKLQFSDKMNLSRGDDSKDPQDVWRIVHKSLNNLMAAKESEVEKVVRKVINIVQSFPQIVTGTQNYPDTDDQLKSRRIAFIRCIVRRTAHLSVKHSNIIPVLVELVNSTLTIIQEENLILWRRLVSSLLQFWSQLCDIAQTMEADVEFVSQSCQIFSLSDITVDDMFSDDYNLLVLNTDIIKLENVQRFCTNLIRLQEQSIKEEKSRGRIKKLCLNQLEIGEVNLKVESLKLLARLGVCGSLELWIEESHYLAAILCLVTSDDLTTSEADSLEAAWVECVEALVPAMTECHTRIMATSLFPIWNSLSDTDQFKNRSQQLLSSIQKLMDTCIRAEENTGMVRSLITEKSPPDIQLLGAVTFTEFVQSEAWRTREDRQKLSLVLISQTWNTLTAQVLACLDLWDNLIQFCSVLDNLLRTIISEDNSVLIEMMSKSTLEEISKSIARRLYDGVDVSVDAVLGCVETLLHVCHVWPGSSSLASPILGVQHLLTGLLSLPWLLENAKTLDLNMLDLRDILSGQGTFQSWTMDNKNRALALLFHLPKEVCPKWRLSVARAAWAEKCPGLVSVLPALITNTALASGFVGDVISHILGRTEDQEMVRRLAAVSGDYLCSLVKRNSSQLVTKAGGRLSLSLVCQDSEGGRTMFVGRTPVKSDSAKTPVKSVSVKRVPSAEVESFLKLIGHQDRNVRISLLSLLKPLAHYSSISIEAADLWMNYVSDEDPEVRQAFAENIRWMFSASSDTLSGDQTQVAARVVTRLTELTPVQDQLDTFIATLVASLRAKPDEKISQSLLDILLKLLVSPDMMTRVTTSVLAINCLTSCMVTHKNHILAWSARAMCSGDHSAKEILEYPLMKCSSEESQRALLENNLHHLLPPIILHSVKDKEKSIAAAEETLDVISRCLGKKKPVMLSDHLPHLLSHAVMFADNWTHFKKSIKFLEEKMSVQLSVLIKGHRNRILVELLKHYSYSKVRINQALNLCANADPAFEHAEKTNNGKALSMTALASYMSQGFMGALATFTTSLSHRDTTAKVKILILRSLNDLIPVLGHQHLVTSKFAVLDCIKMATNLSTQDQIFEEIALTLWNSFVHTLEIPSLVGILPQMLCFLLPHLSSSPAQTLELFKFLLVDNIEHFQSNLKQLMFLPPEPELEAITETIRGKDPNFKEVLGHLMLCLENESVDLRLQSLKTLSTLLDCNIVTLQNLVISSDRTDPIITQLIAALTSLLSIREPEPMVRRYAGICLGKIGPVDPGRLEFKVNLAQSYEDIAATNKLLDVFSVGFCVELLQELIRAKSSLREPLVAENCAFSLQEVLKVYEINLDDKNPNTFTWRVWRQLSDCNQEKLTPLLSSMYAHNSSVKEDLPSPLFLTAYGKNYKDWLVNYCHFLMDLIKDRKTKSLFEACLPSMKKDLGIAESLLPRLVIEVLCCCGDEMIDSLLNEMLEILAKEDQVPSSEENFASSIAGALASIVDHIGLWLRAKYHHLIQATRRTEDKLKPDEIRAALKKSPEYIRVKEFTRRLPHYKLANFHFRVGAYHRSAYHFDLYLKEAKPTNSNFISALLTIYGRLEEPDLVIGAAAVKETEPGIQDLIHLHKATGNYQDAIACYDKMKTDPASHLYCLLEIGLPKAAADRAAAYIKEDSSLSQFLAAAQVDAAWQLGQWEDLDTAADRWPDNELCFEVGLGRVLSAMKREEWATMRDTLDKLRVDLVEKVSNSCSLEAGVYVNSYTKIHKLGMLSEVQQIAEKFLIPSPKQITGTTGATDLLLEFSNRIDLSQNSWKIVGPMLRLRRVCLEMARDRVMPFNEELAKRFDFEIGDIWIRSAKLAREAGMYPEAYRFLLETKGFKNIETFLESARLSWDRGQGWDAISILNKGLSDYFPRVELESQRCNGPDSKDRSRHLLTVVQALSPTELSGLCAGKLLLAKYQEESKSISSEAVRNIYNQLKSYCKTDEEVHFQYASSVDKQIQKLSPEQQLQHSELIYHTCIGYIRSMQHGPTHLYYCLPRLLTLWLDFTENIEEFVKKKGKTIALSSAIEHAANVFDKFIANYSQWKNYIPDYFYLTALPQLVSRICHPHAKSYQVLSSMLTSLLSGPHSQQTFWHMVSVSKNRNEVRRSRCLQMFEDAKKVSPQIRKTLEDSMTLASKIDELCDYKVDKGIRSIRLQEHMKSLPALVNRSQAANIILPNQRNLLVTLPTDNTDLHRHQPFPSGLVYIQSIDDEVTVMTSLVQPKKITFLGSDGHRYAFLAKPKDDLRRDSRLMDYSCLLNKLFKKDFKSRSRNLHIRTYCVIPTNETSGLIEWADNLKAIRPIIYQLHKDEGRYINIKWTQQYQLPEGASLEEKRKNLLQCLQDQKGPVFSNWFAKNFTDPQSWFIARMAYVRSTAVMSMMGYIIGLGDRHLENINVDTTTGDTFHVDMNCLFNKGETLTVPEVVPFRLTHNMVDAFGPVGVEGPFRIACEIALKVMRNEKDVLMSMLRPFVFDPLVDWAKENKSKSGGADIGQEHLKRVEDRLTGYVTDPLESKKKEKRKKTLINHGLSVEGQVNHLINEAKSIDNLAVMYWGWAPYL